MTLLERAELSMIIEAAVEAGVRRVLGSGGLPAPCPAPLPEPESIGPAMTDNPFLMNDAELKYAEQLLPVEDRPILRIRVMAARLAAKGHWASAEKMRRRADTMEHKLRRAA